MLIYHIWLNITGPFVKSLGIDNPPLQVLSTYLKLRNNLETRSEPFTESFRIWIDSLAADSLSVVLKVPVVTAGRKFDFLVVTTGRKFDWLWFDFAA